PPRVGSLSVIGEQRRVLHFSQYGTGSLNMPLDVPPSYPFYKEIAVLGRNNGLAADCGPSLFCPEAPTTRGVMAQFIIRSIYGGDPLVPPQSPVAFFSD